MNIPVTIFICTHRPIENPIPMGPEYKIISQSREVVDSNHEVIYIDNDEFTKKHWRCYGEGCAMYYMYRHPEILGDIVGLAHYRRFLMAAVNHPRLIKRIVEEKGAFIQRPFNHSGSYRGTNKGAMYEDHVKDEADVLIDCVKEVAPEYLDSFNEMLSSKWQYACNLFLMKKEDFLEMAEMCFRILFHYDKKQGFKDNYDVYVKMLRYEREDKLRMRASGWHTISWHSRLQGFWLEWLTETYYRHKWGVDNVFISHVGIPKKKR